MYIDQTSKDSTKANSQLDNWKKQLIDFSKRNQLLFFKARPSLTIELQEEAITIFKKLVLESKTLGFKEQVSSFDTTEFDAITEDGMEVEFEDFESEPVLTPELAEDIDLSNTLLADKDARSLEQVLAKLKIRSQASLHEQGVNILYLALYFLNWQDTNNEIAKSPLILIPVTLNRKGLSGAFKLSLIDDELRINPTLAYKLERDYGIKLGYIESRLAEIEDEEELIKLIDELRGLVTKDHKNWELLDSSCLSLFSFAKLSLYKDIEDNEKKIVQHPIIKQIAGELLEESYINQQVDPRYWVSSKEIDRKINANESQQILDADSSQEEAIYAAKAGRSFVIQGPPGTGKSQTIANIIAESLSQGKKVLFVSEKKSALDVVIKRLKDSRLERFCLELHNSQQKKADIISNLRTSLEEIKSIALESNREEYIESINQLKGQIQKAIDELHKTREPIQMSLYEIYGELASLNHELDLLGQGLKQSQDLLAIDFTIPSIEKFDLKRLSELDHLFKQLAAKTEILENYDSYIWRNANVSNLSFELENEIKSNLIEFKSIVAKLESFANPISEKYFGRKVKNLKEFKWLAEASNLATNSPFPKREWFNGNRLTEVQTLAIQAQFEHEGYRSSRQEILGRYSEGFLELNHEELLTKFTQKFTGIFRFLDIDYWRSVSQIKKLSFHNQAKDIKDIINDLQQAAELDQKSKELHTEGTELSLVLGDFYKEFDTDWQETITAIKWVQKVLNKFESGVVPTQLVEIVSDSSSQDAVNQFNKQADDLIKAHDLVKYHLEFYSSIFPRPNVDLDNLSFKELSSHLEDLVKNIIKIEDWIEYKEQEQIAKSLGMEQFVEAIIKASIQGVNETILKDLFLRKLYQAWVDKIEISHPEIRKFSGNGQQILIDKFNMMDLKIQGRNRKQISKNLALNWIEYAANAINKIDLQVLNHEINKKKKHKPIRLLLQEIPELLQTLKPCWMMSPLSVSRLIDSSNNDNSRINSLEFDLVIFDEASQIKTEDAICSIYRGKQLILAGDSNQLPPTNFFNYIDNDDDYENHNFESVLDECSVFLETKTLNWHYRSRHEDLIKFSNYHIYDNQLITFPSPINKAENLGIAFELVVDGYYERGSRFNRKEATRVAEAIVEHYKQYPEVSLGVIAFSEAQQFAIERELSKILKKNPELDHSFLDEEKTDALFIKNLENVQGDERDVIFFSIGYARDKKGNLSHNFGPLNRDGGHRRLNVAVTRARNQLKVFSSIVSSDIDLNRTSAQGAVLLKKYLAFAENPNPNSGDLFSDMQNASLILANQNLNSSSKSKVSKSIAEALKQRGYDVELSLGASEYKIDIAVKSKTNPSEYILAIETDGEVYRSAHTARDRERLRRAVLESLGWTVHKVWARDWIRNEAEELAKILKLIK